MTGTEHSGRLRRVLVHGLRIACFVLILLLIHFNHRQLVSRQAVHGAVFVDVERLRPFFPEADSLSETIRGHGGSVVLDRFGKQLGYVLQTSPQSDHIVGFSGPTNILIAFNNDDRIRGIEILSSGDTRDHVAQVRENAEFMHSLDGATWDEAMSPTDVDAVSGATLTSLAIEESIIYRLGGGKPSLRFPEALTLEIAQRLIKNAVSIEPDEDRNSLWNVYGSERLKLGTILRTSPTADNIIGYQGPTEALISFNADGNVIGITLGNSYDNDEYVRYVREDDYFLSLFNGMTLDELAELDLQAAQMEGVSGATMTSMAVAEGVVKSADEHRQTPIPTAPSKRRFSTISARDVGTAAVILAGLILGFTSLRANKTVRVGFQLLLIGYLGFVNGDMVSQAMLVGWAQSGIAWRTAPGLVLLTAAAFIVPLTTRRNVYCTHLCPHGAVQQLIKNRVPWRMRIPRWLSRAMLLIPAMLLVWCILVAMTSLPFSLVDIEPFDAWVFRVAGWATMTIAVVGLVVSLFVPMAYCRYGCPTGALLNYLRFNSRSDRVNRRDLVAIVLVLLALCLWGF